jgi:hypothetical protein
MYACGDSAALIGLALLRHYCPDVGFQLILTHHKYITLFYGFLVSCNGAVLLLGALLYLIGIFPQLLVHERIYSPHAHFGNSTV